MRKKSKKRKPIKHMYTGTQVKESIVSRKRSIQAQIDAIDNQISSVESTIQQNNSVREDTLLKLSERYLSDGGKLATQFQNVNKRVQNIFAEKSRRRENIISQLDQLQFEENALNVKINNIIKEIFQKEEEITKITGFITDDLSHNPEYNQLSEQIKELTELLRKDEIRLGSLETEYNKQSEVYLSDPFFVYLLELEFGTPNYSGGFFHKQDAWLAKITNYTNNKQRYDILGQIPGRVRAANAMRKAQSEQKKIAIQSITDSVESKFGLKAARSSLAVLQETRNSYNIRMEIINSSQRDLILEKQNIDTNKDPFQKRAKDEIKAFFASQDVSDLMRIAGNDTNNELLVILKTAEENINKNRKIAKSLIADRGELEKKIEKINSIVTRYSREDYDSHRSRFDGQLDVECLVDNYVAGSISQDSVFTSIASVHSVYTEPPAPSYSSRSSDDSYSSRSSSSDSYSSSSSWSDSSSSSGGGFDGGGCSSGGDF